MAHTLTLGEDATDEEGSLMSMSTYEGNLIATGAKFGIVVARFNELLSSRLLSGAKDALIRHGVAEDDIDVAWVPGRVRDPARRGQAGRERAATTP